MRPHAGRKFWPQFGAEILQLLAIFFPPLIYLLFIFCPAARPSSVVLWRAGGVFSSLTNVLEIARRMSMGEHLNLGHTLLLQFFCKGFDSPFFTFFSAVLPDWFSRIKEELLTCFQPGFSVWILRMERGTPQHLCFYCFQAQLFISTRDHFFLCPRLNHYNFYLCRHTGTACYGEGAAPLLCSAGGDTACCGTVMVSSINRTTPWQASWGHFGDHGDHRIGWFVF